MFENYSLADLLANTYKNFKKNIIVALAAFLVVLAPFVLKAVQHKDADTSHGTNYSTYIVYNVESDRVSVGENGEKLEPFSEFFANLIYANMNGAYIFEDVDEKVLDKISDDLSIDKVQLRNTDSNYWYGKIEVKSTAENGSVTVRLLTASEEFNELVEEKVDALVKEAETHLENVTINKVNSFTTSSPTDTENEDEIAVKGVAINKGTIIKGAVIAFIFAVTITNTINKEATIIGTLRASGYSKREITAHYMEIPLIVTIISAIIGNILGYTVFKYVCVGMYYGSYSLPTYTTVWSAEAFVLTTLVPFIIMLVVNYVFIRKKLRLSPMKFIRNDLSTSKKKKAIRLPHFKFFNRFRIRVIIQNRYNYLTLFVGIIFANLLLLFGLMLPALLDSYNDSIIEHMAAKYQYVLKTPLETETKDVEKYFMSTVEKTGDNGEKDDISVYGISDDSKYLSMDFESGKVYVSDVFADKYRLKKGDKFTLKESYGTKKHTFEIGGVYEYPIGLTIFMNKKDFCKEFNVKDNEFTGYFSNKKIKDIEQEYIYSVITQDDLTKMARQMDVSMGSMMNMVNIVSVLLSMLVMYLLIKLVIEKNSLSISMVKILGYDNNEIRKLYLTATTWVVIACVALSIPVVVWIIKDLIYRPMMMEMKGWIILKMDPIVYGEMFILGMLAYAVVSFLEFRKIKKIPMTDALKNVE